MDVFDHVIVGGGIVGSATALALARTGRSVALIEARRIAAGASGGPGMRGVRANARHPAELRLAAAAQRIWPDLDEDLGVPTGYARRGGIELFDGAAVAADGGAERLQIRAALQSQLGVQSEVLERAALQDRLGPLGTGVSHGIFVEADGVAPPAQTTAAYAAAARRAGVTIREDCSAVALTEASEGVRVETDQGALRATRTVAVCANVAARQLLRTVSATDLPLWNVAFHAFFLAPEQPWELPHLIGHDSVALAAKTVEDGLMQVSGFLTAPWDAKAERSLARNELFAGGESRFRDVFPTFPAARVVGREARQETCSPDRLQIIDRVPGTRSIFVAAGWSGHGFATAPAVGPAFAGWMASGERPELFDPFRWDRW